MKEKIIIIPGAFDLVKNYGGYPGIDIWMGESQEDEKLLAQADWIFAASSGPNYVLSSPALNKQKLIFLNPLVKKRTLFSLLIRCIRFMLSEKVGIERLISPSRWIYGLRKLYHIIKFDTLAALKKLPREQVMVIRGKNDRFFCDKESVEILKQEGIPFIEVEAGHIWNKNVADAVRNIIDTGNILSDTPIE